MQLKLRETLRAQRHQTGIVRTRADFGEPHLVALDEQLDAEYAAPAQRLGHFVRDIARAFQRQRRHRLRLPRFDIVAVDLQVTNSLAEMGGDLAVRVQRTYRQQRDFILELNEAFDDHATAVHAPPRHRIVPGLPDIGCTADH